MSDRGRSRRTARSTKATPPKAEAPEATETDETAAETSAEASVAEEPTAGVDAAAAESDTSDSDASPGGAAKDAPEDPAEEPAAEDEAAGETVAEADDEAGDEGETAKEADGDAAHAEGKDAAEGGAAKDLAADGDAADAEGKDGAEGSKPAKEPKSKAPAPLTKAQQRSAARVAAAKARRRRNAGAAVAGTLIVALVVGGAFAGVWYFGNRAAENRVHCKPPEQVTFPPLLGGMDERLATEPTVSAGTGDVTVLDKKILIEGDCKTVKAGQTVTVNYVGVTFKDGKLFDSSWPKKQTFETTVGQKQLGKQLQVIEGWDEGLVGVKVGSRVQLDIPPKLAYGDTPPQGAPVGPLRFVVDVLDAKDAEDTGGFPGGLGN